MATPVYPATNNAEAIELNISNANQFFTILQGGIDDFIVTYEGNGEIPSVAKALHEAAAYKAPLPWETTGEETDLLQPRVFEGGVYAPLQIPAPFSATPDSNNWRLLQNDVVKSTIDATSDPTVNSDATQGYSVNSLWINQSTSEVFRCLDATVGAAVWVKTTLTIDELGSLAIGDDATDVPYNNTASGLSATNTQAAIDEVDAELDAHKSAPDPHPQYVLETDLDSYVVESDLAANTGASLVGTSSGDTVEGAINQRTIYVGSVAELRALPSPTSGQQVSVGEYRVGTGSGGGMFTWISGDQSALVAMDSAGGVWIPPSADPSGASGAWGRQIGEHLTLDDFGVISEPGVDCRDAINSAVVVAASLKKPLVWPPKSYYIKADDEGSWLYDGINAVSGSHWIMSPETELRALPSAQGRYAILSIRNVDNIHIDFNGARLIGERNEHTGTGGEHGQGMDIRTVNHMVLNDPQCIDCWGDGIYLNDISNAVIADPICDNNRRQGISLISADNLKILRPKCTNTNGTAPAAGIDIEPNSPNERLENILIDAPILEGNTGGGLAFYFQAFTGAVSPVSITVRNPILTNNHMLFNGPADVGGFIDITRPVVKDTIRRTFRFQTWEGANAPLISIYRPIAINVNSGGSNWGADAAPMFDFVAGAVSNIHIYEPEMVTSASKPSSLAYFTHPPTGNVQIINPVNVDTTSAASIVVNGDAGDALIVEDQRGVLSRTASGEFTVQREHRYSELFVEDTTVDHNITLQAQASDKHTLKITKRDAFRTTINAGTGRIYPMDVAYIRATGRGSTVTLRSDSGDWVVESWSGAWTTS